MSAVDEAYAVCAGAVAPVHMLLASSIVRLSNYTRNLTGTPDQKEGDASARTPLFQSAPFCREAPVSSGKIARRGRRRKRWQSRDRAIRTFAPSLALGQVAEEEEARRCHRLGRRTGTNAIGWLAGLVARLPLPWRAVQGQTPESAIYASISALASCEQ